MNTLVHDPAIPILELALDAESVRPFLRRHLGEIFVSSATLRRHKPGRRCLIEYTIETPDGPERILGKVRAKGLDSVGYETHLACWNAGLPVPEPLAAIPELRMWLQRLVPGQTATTHIGNPGSVELVTRIARSVHLLHRAGIPTKRKHTILDELGILYDRLEPLTEGLPRWGSRIHRILTDCQRFASVTEPPYVCGIHRDFYGDQILVHGPDLYLLDLDLYCLGDPGLDIGNFIGHLIEQSLRTVGHPDAFVDHQHAMEQCMVDLHGEAILSSIRTYTTLTLVRHIAICKRFPERKHMVLDLIDLCAERLNAGLLAR